MRAHALATFVVAVVSFLPALGNGFLALDDDRVIGALFLKRFDLQGLATCFWPFPLREEWLPVRDFTYMVNFLVSDGPLGFVIGNLVFHGLCAVALLALLRRVFDDRDDGPALALAGALVFAVHPLHAESVAWISGRKDLLATLFCLLATVAWIDASRAGDAARARRLDMAAVALLALALFSKAVASALPLLLAAASLGVGPRGSPRSLALRLAPHFAITGAFTLGYTRVVKMWAAESGELVMKSLPPGHAWPLVLTDASALAQYLGRLALPLDDRLLSDQDMVRVLDGPALLALAVALGSILGTVVLARARPRVGFLAAWFFLALLPCLNVVVVNGIWYAERYVYLASAGGAGVLVALAASPGRRLPRPVVILLLAAWLVFAGARSWSLASVFKDERTLFEHVLEREPGNRPALSGLAAWWFDRDPARAESLYRRALDVHARKPKDHYNLALLLERSGRLDEAARHYETSFRLAPGSPRAIYGLAQVAWKRARPFEALELYDRLIERWPARAGRAAWQRAVLLEAGGDRALARGAWRLYLDRWGSRPEESGHADLARKRLAALGE